MFPLRGMARNIGEARNSARVVRLLDFFKLHRLRLHTTATVVNLLAAVFLVCCANGPLWRAFASALGTTGGHGLLWIAGVALVLVFNSLLSLLSFRPVHKPLLIVVFGIA